MILVFHCLGLITSILKRDGHNKSWGALPPSLKVFGADPINFVSASDFRARPNGCPLRYMRYAQGFIGLIWIEDVVVVVLIPR
jgi:hypothetical protein